MSEKKTGGSSGDVPRTGHIYDGIEELDHGIPVWFTGLFVVTVIAGLIYGAYYGLGPGPSLLDEYRQEEAAARELEAKRLALSGGPKSYTDQELRALAAQPEKVRQGDGIYQGKCASCHGKHGEGGIGPNMTDRHWLHGGKPAQILATLNQGVLDKGMPGWGSILKPEESAAVTAYILSLAGTQPAGAKAPQGTVQE